MDEREVRCFGYCENCGDEVTDDYGEYYITDNGEVFCCVDCICEHYGLTRIEV